MIDQYGHWGGCQHLPIVVVMLYSVMGGGEPQRWGGHDVKYIACPALTPVHSVEALFCGLHCTGVCVQHSNKALLESHQEGHSLSAMVWVFGQVRRRPVRAPYGRTSE